MADVTAGIVIPRTQTQSQRFLGLARVAWAIIAAFLFVLFLIGVAGAYRMMQTPCAVDGSDCLSWAQPTPDKVALIEQAGISLQTSAVYFTVLYTAASLIFWTVGALIYRHRSDRWFSLVTATLMVQLGAAGVSMVFASGADFAGLPAAVGIAFGLLALPLYQVLSIFFLTFPNGRFYGRWNVIPFVLICLNTLAWIAPPPYNIEYWSPSLSSLWLMIVFGSHLLVQIIRYRGMYTQTERRQAKWLIYGFSVPVTMILAVGLIQSGLPPAEQRLHPLVDGTLVVLLYLPIGLAVGIAILRHRLWDIDVIIQRSLIYGGLTALVVGVYVLLVGALSALFQANGNFVISLVATGVVAVCFQPLRERLQLLANRLVFGQRSEPYAVMSRLSESMEEAVPASRLPGIAETVAQALKLPYVAIALINGDGFKTDAVYGQPVDRGRITTVQLAYGQEVVGQMIIGQTAGDKTLDERERDLLDNIARQTGVAAHAIQLSQELQQSRQQIVTAREEERRRLRRDLHDGLGPALAAHTIKIGTARALVDSDPTTASRILDELETNLANSLADIRRLVYNLRPPALDQLGLVGALQDFLQQCGSSPAFTLEVTEPLPPLPAAIEVAAYRIVQEAVNNIMRHARAQHGTVALKIEEHEVSITLQDDGQGLPKPVTYGVGLTSMRERAEELGGQFSLASAPGEGTLVRVRLPL